MRGFKGLAGFLLALTLGACSSAPATLAPGSFLLYVVEGNGISRLASDNAASVSWGEGALLPDGSAVLQVAPLSGSGQTMVNREPLRAGTQVRRDFDGFWTLAWAGGRREFASGIPRPFGLSPLGRQLVLASTDAFQVISTADLAASGKIPATGSFLAADDAGRWLYTYGPGGILRYEVVGGFQEPQIVLDDLPGSFDAGVVSFDGRYFYAVFTQNDRPGYLLVLDLERGSTRRLDFAGSLGTGPWAMAITHDGRTVYAVSSGWGQVEVYDTDSGRLRLVRFEVPRGTASFVDDAYAKGLLYTPPALAAISPAGDRLAVGGGYRGLVLLDAHTLRVVRTALPAYTVSSALFGPDGRRLFAVAQGSGSPSLAEIDVETGAVIRWISSASGPRQLLLVQSN